MNEKKQNIDIDPQETLEWQESFGPFLTIKEQKELII